MNIDAVILEMNGTDSRILDISTIFGSEQYGQVFQSNSGSEADHFYGAIRLDINHADNDASLKSATKWIVANSSALIEIECDKVLEIQILFHEEGCDFLCLDNAFLEIAAQAGLHVHVQVSRQVLS